MIVLHNLTKTFSIQGQRKTVADRINATFPTGVSVGLLGRNGAGKSTLLKLIAGTTHPTSGRVLSTGSVSFPVGLASSLHPDLTGAQNTRFVARIYNVDTDYLMAFVEDFAELGKHFHLPVRTYSSGMGGRLTFGINMGIQFDTYLIDEITAVGDAAFKAKSSDLFLRRMRNAGSIYVSHSMGAIKDLCTAGAFLEDGKLTYYDTIDEAIERYNFTLGANKTANQNRPASAATASGRPAGGPSAAASGGPALLYLCGLKNTKATWVAEALRRHRAVYMPPGEEPHYFDVRAGISPAVLQRRLRLMQEITAEAVRFEGDQRLRLLGRLRGVSQLITLHTAQPKGDSHVGYLDYMTAGRISQPVICDFTQDYAKLTLSDFEVMKNTGRARFAVVLRDPAERLWSQLYDAAPADQKTAEGCLGRLASIVASDRLLQAFPESDYQRLIGDLDAAAGTDQVLWLFDEQLEGTESLSPLLNFLDLPPLDADRIPEFPPEAAPDMSAEGRALLLQALGPQYAFCAERFGAALPESWNKPVAVTV